MSFRATVPALYLWGFIRLPCIHASWIFLFCSSVQSSTHVGPARFSLSGERCRGVAASNRLEGKLRPSCVVLYEPPAVSAAYFHPRSFLHLLGSSSSPSPSRPRFLPPEPPAPLVLGPPPSCAPLPPLVPAPPPAHWLLSRLAPAGASCTTRGLLGYLGSVCQLNAFLFRGVFVPVDFGHWDLLSVFSSGSW